MVNDSGNYLFAKESREEYMEDHIFMYVVNLCKVILTSEEQIIFYGHICKIAVLFLWMKLVWFPSRYAISKIAMCKST